ncbi:PaaI family thioesterase [Leucobacter allii]|uniref:PaaI family thioesterase n=1 Tax=Leucobacter allii TaxID=2932247 RepID=A0ABY4FL21_9MICO|nr:PaaI family thioesterase [Leucobacter allii]UOQ56967.1 PaaI family thioesterase [Leucobacter allii]
MSSAFSALGADSTAAEVEAALLAAPYHRWLGLRVHAFGPEGIELRATVAPEWLNNDEGGVVHGGIIAALLDIAADWALLSRGIAPSPTIDQTVHYLRAAAGEELVVTGVVRKPGRAVSVAEATLTSDGREVAVSRASYATAG